MIKFYQFISGFFALLMVGTSSTSHAFSLQDIPSYTLRYSVSYKGNAIGELEIAIKKSNDNVIVRGETFPNALASLIGDGKVIETIEYTELDDKLLLTRLTEKKGASDPKIKQVNVDHENLVLTTHTDQIAISKDDQIDAYTFPLLSILGLADSSKGSEEKLVSVGKVRDYHYNTPVQEVITTDAGQFKTLKTSKSRGNKSKTITLWLTETDPIMPVQIQVDRKGRLDVSIALIKILP